MTKRQKVIRTIADYAKTSDEPMRVKEGKRHTRVWVGEKYTTIPRHKEIPDRLAEKIYKQIGVKK